MQFESLTYGPEELEHTDMMIEINACVVMRAPLGSLVALRTQLRNLLGASVKAFRIHSNNMYIAQWKELTDETQDAIRKNRHERRTRS